MNGHGVGRFQLGEHIEGVFRRPVVKLDGHRLFLKVDVRDRADIAVEYAGSRAKPVGPFPHYIIVIPDLHYPIAGSEGKISVFFFFFALRRRIQHGLQRKIQRLCARLVLAAGAEHLNVGRLDAHVFRQPRLAKLLYGLHGCRRVAAAQEEKVPVRRREHGQLALIDRVGVHDDQAPLRLPENFRQADGLYHAAADEVGKHVSRADRRQLIRVADQQQAAAGLERL